MNKGLNHGFRVRAFDEGAGYLNAVGLVVIGPHNKVCNAQITIQGEVEEGCMADPCIRLMRDHAQQLLDDLWRVGLRPSEAYEPKQGQLKATEAHLEDLRVIVREFLSGRRVT